MSEWSETSTHKTTVKLALDESNLAWWFSPLCSRKIAHFVLSKNQSITRSNKCTVYLLLCMYLMTLFECYVQWIYFYRVRIQAVNGIGVGAFSSPVKVTTRPLPPNPSKLECGTYAPNSLKLKWGDGRNLDLLTYTLEMEKEDGK